MHLFPYRPPWVRSSGSAGLLLAGSLFAFVGYVLLRPGRYGMIDLGVYRAGAAAVLHGRSLYPHQGHDVAAFTYPPFAGLVLAPLGVVPSAVAKLVVTAATLACLVWCVRLCLAAAGVDADRFQPALLGTLAVALWTEPVRATLELGQVNLLLMALVLADLTGHTGRLPRGVLVGVAAGLKLTPAIFVVHLLLTGQRRAAATAAGSFAATAGIGFLLLPADSVTFWRLLADPARVGGIAYVGNEAGMQYISNQSLHGAATRLLGGPAAARPVWLATALLTGVVGLLVAAALARSGGALAGIGMCGLTGLLLSPISWTHHWVWVLPGTVAVAARLRAGSGWWRPGLLAGWVGLFLLAPVWWVRSGAGREYGEHGVALLAGNSYLLAGVAAAAAATVRCLRRRPAVVPRRAPAEREPGPRSSDGCPQSAAAEGAVTCSNSSGSSSVVPSSAGSRSSSSPAGPPSRSG